MPGRKIHDEAEAIGALDSIARTGLELADWCRARGIDARSLTGWRGGLESRGYEPPVERAQPDFVEVVHIPVEPSARYTIRHRGLRRADPLRRPRRDPARQQRERA